MRVDLFWNGIGNPEQEIINQNGDWTKWNPKLIRSNPTSFPAKFRSLCPGCLNAIEIGQQIEYLPGQETCAHSKADCIKEGRKRLAEVPVCFNCNTPMKFQYGSRGAFWACRNKCKKDGKAVTLTLTAQIEDPETDKPKSIIAKISSKCCVCNQWMTKGVDRIQPLDKVKGVWVHVNCYSEGTELSNKRITCPSCNTPNMVLLNGKFGPFWSCAKYPNCKQTISFSETKNLQETPQIKEEVEEITSSQRSAVLQGIEKSLENGIFPVRTQEVANFGFGHPKYIALTAKVLAALKQEGVVGFGAEKGWTLIEENKQEPIVEELFAQETPRVELSKAKFTLWLDEEFTQPYLFKRGELEKHAGSDSLEKVQQVVEMVRQKTGITIYVKHG